MAERTFTDEELSRIETGAHPDAIPELVQALREQQRRLESLRLSMDVALRDRDELRAALLRCKEEVRRTGGG